MHLHHARPPLRHRRPLPLPQRQGAGIRRPRRQPPAMEPRKAELRPGTHEPSPHEGGRGMCRRVEPRWSVDSQWRRGRGGQGLCEIACECYGWRVMVQTSFLVLL